jgi:excisionase family DNA binding protein
MTLDDVIRRLEEMAQDTAKMGAKAPVGETLFWVLGLLHAVDHVPNGGPDRLLTAQEVAPRLGIHKRTVYAQADTWPFTRRIGRSVRFSEHGLTAWLSRS